MNSNLILLTTPYTFILQKFYLLYFLIVPATKHNCIARRRRHNHLLIRLDLAIFTISLLHSTHIYLLYLIQYSEHLDYSQDSQKSFKYFAE